MHWSFNSSRIGLTAGIAASILLALMILTSPKKLCYDEPYHIGLARSVQTLGWRAALNSPDNASAAGPLYAALHLAAAPLTGFQAPCVRWINFLCLALVVVMLGGANRGNVAGIDWCMGLSILSVPFLWPATGMALTELPALTAFTLFVVCVLKMIRTPDDRMTLSSFGWAGLAGLALGLAILGRQTYLIVLPALAAMLVVAPSKWRLWLVCIAVGLGSCGWLFFLWGGLVPPFQQNVGSGIRLDHGVLSLSYVAAATLFLNPRWLKPGSPKVILGVIVAGVGLAMLTHDYGSPPAKSLLIKVFGGQGSLRIGFCIAAFFASAALLWAWNMLSAAWRERTDPSRVFLYLTLFALVAAPVKVTHQFSSRYVVGLLGVLVLVVGTSRAIPKLQAMTILLGAGLGAGSLWTYFHP